ncbi:MAG: magnesium/cobalt transporter CorA [Flavobacteriales bacterium]|nr:magnesium/cobalt transporter CorA [Flavobacteriales bacterium]MCB9196382.1 magnesium/cobalt transporter CorA [Flavobacteriales bacterium]MCB9198535.1 magnesium/cobalt transporter CorA [Flavobacteriales bacterium]
MIQSDAQIFSYNESFCDANFELDVTAIDNLKNGTTHQGWLNFHSMEEKVLIEHAFSHFNIHKVTQKDILELNERPKVEEFEDYIFTTLKSIHRKKKKIKIEQISFVLKENILISFQERHGDLFGEVRSRLKNNTGIVRTRKADYLLYLLIDSVLKGYQKVLSDVQSNIDNTQIIVYKNYDESFFRRIEEYQNELKMLKKSLSPLRDQLIKLSNSRTKFIQDINLPYFNDLKDKILYLFDEIEEEKSDLESMTNQYFAVLSQRSNEVMQFLTIIAALFIPLTFIVGVYGMNFENMPELKSTYGYYIVWGVMIIITIGLILYFRKKGWF